MSDKGKAPHPDDGGADERVEGRNPVLEALRGPRKVRRVFISAGSEKKAALKEIITLAGSTGVPVEEIDRRRLDDMSMTSSPQGVVAQVQPYPYLSLGELLDSVKRVILPMVLVLDGVEDPRNLGSLIRTSDAVGMHAVVIAKHRSASVTPVVASASAGAVEHVRLARVPNIAEALRRLKDAGLWTFGAREDADNPYYKADMGLPLAIVLGGEGKGLSRLTVELCDFLVSIPMSGKVDSLNVAVAGAVLMFEAARRRGSGVK
jgi:23S rRNA (guanosine2251-2'-O)-methyltransferase